MGPSVALEMMLTKLLFLIKRFLYNASVGWDKFTSFIPIYGVSGTVSLLMWNFLWVEIQYRLEKDLNTSDPFVHPRIPVNVVFYCKGFDVSRWKSKEEVVKLRGKFALRRFQERLDRGEILFVGYWQDTIVGFVWVQFPPLTDAGYALSDSEAYTLDGWTFEEYRGKRVLPVIQQAIMSYVRNERPTIERLVTHVAVKNRASISGDQRAGYTIIRKELSIAVMGFYKRFVLRSRIHRSADASVRTN